ncbi:hypothetical protein HDV00_007926 [Rhizophlyctis rosea]|nr:hypothetical protein HDV00_007926 [Rhizophlyctis rosea]
MSWVEKFITRHFGGVPRKFEDLAWLIRVRPNVDPPIIVKADEYRTISPGSQPTYVPPVNDKIAKNYYYTRDTRRAYPQTVTYSSQEVMKALPQVEIKALPRDPLQPAQPALLPSPEQFGLTTPTFPPIINRRYTYKPASPALKPDDYLNPDFSIIGRT